MWPSEPNGIYSVRNGYHAIQRWNSTENAKPSTCVPE